MSLSAKPSIEDYERLGAQIITTLPDSLTERREMLQSMLKICRCKSPCAKAAEEMLWHLTEQEKLQRSLPLLKHV